MQNQRRRNFRTYPPRFGTIRASQGVPATLANVYFRLRRGTPEQRAKAEEFKELVLDMGRGLA